ncbi:MAG TPA: tetratricopeptide repeat protein [Candidatus Sulfotelmatobacter sp.]|nr:tetratricopeptide repeat protein [Candidatus Sulfotelmatobacter sp.]
MKAPCRAATALLLLCLTTFPSGASDQTNLSAAAALAAHKQWTEAADQVELYRREHPDSVEAALLQSEIWIHLGLLSDANGILRRILAIYPHSVDALSASAELSRTLGDKATAETLLLRCTRYAPRSAEVWKRLGDFYLSLGRKEALSAFQHAETLAPGDPVAKAGVASARHQQGQDALAEHDFRRATLLNNGAPRPDPMVDYLYAEFLQDKGQYNESVSENDRALQQDSDLLDAHLGRAKSLVRLRQWARAESDLRLCLKDDDKNIAALNLLTKVAQAEGKNDEAQQYAKQVEQLSGAAVADKATNNQIASLLQNARSLMLSKHFAEAAQSYQQLLHDHGNISEAWLHLGQCHAEVGQLDEAQSDVRHFLSMEGKSASGHVLLGRILLRQAQTATARDEFLQAQNIDPLFVDARLGIAASYIVESNYPEAIRILRAVTASPGVSSDSRLMLTEALYKNQEPAEALHELNRLLKRDPSNRAALQMKASLTPQSMQP